ELENAVEYAASLETGPSIGLDSVPTRIRRQLDGLRNDRGTLKEKVRQFEASVLRASLARHGASGGKEAVARELGISRASLYRKLREIRL
ncbi:MAG TPA: transcriptional regulator, partial [Firmicutes bacterium]|nr:transcriptional regulator [Bacillota bacterium]